MKGWNKIFKKVFVILIIFILLFCLFNFILNNNCIKAKEGEKLFVGGEGIGNFTKIQDAIDNSSNSDTLIVYPGTYNESILINKSINLVGLNKNLTIIKGNKSIYIISVKSSNVNITNFTIKNGRIGIYIYDADYSYTKILNNIFTENTEGIRFQNTSYNIITKNEFFNNKEYNIVLFQSKNNLINKNNLSDSRKALIVSRGSNNNTIIGNNFSNNSISIELDYSFLNKIKANFIGKGGSGIYIIESNKNNVTNNTIIYNNNYGIYLQDSEDNIIKLNIFLNNYNDIKTRGSPPLINTPGFEIILLICAFLFVFLFNKKFFRN